MKKLIAMLLAAVMVLGLFAGCGNNEKPVETTAPQVESTTAPTDPSVVVQTFEGDYTYTDWVSNLSTNWNPHTYSVGSDGYPLGYTAIGLYEAYFNDALHAKEGQDPYASYVIVPEMAAELPVDITAEVAASHPQFNIPEGATEGYAFKIALNPNACWDDGTPIKAYDWVQSFQRLMDPKLQNYRAGGWYEGATEIAGAEMYNNAGLSKIMNVNTVMAKEGLATFEDFLAKYGEATAFINWDDSFESTYDFAAQTWTEGGEDEEVETSVTVNEMVSFFVQSVMERNGVDEAKANELVLKEVYINWTYPEVGFDTVGMYETGEYEFVIVLAKAQSALELADGLGGWLVKLDLYDACLSNNGGAWTSTYNTSLETTASFGPYKMSAYQTDKFIHFVKNENWYGYTDGKHVYVDPEDGLTYPMYQSTEIDCQLISENATAKMMFLKGELMTYGLQTEDIATYRNSEFCYFTPSEAVYYMILNGNMPAIQEREASEDFDQATSDLEMLTLTSFHQAMGMAFDRELYCELQSPANGAAFGLVGSAYIYDSENSLSYRSTDEAKQVLCDVYGVDVSQYASLDDAVAAITGYNPVAAAEYFTQAYNEALELGYVTDADGDGKCDQTVTIVYSLKGSEVTAEDSQRLDWMTEQVNLSTKGTPMEDKIEFQPSAPLGSDWAKNLEAGLTDCAFCGWAGSKDDAFGLMEVFVNSAYQYDANWFDSTSVDLTLTLGGEEITMNLYEWFQVLTGTELYGYNFGAGIGSVEDRLAIMAAMERELLLKYNHIPMYEGGSMSLLSQKAYYVVDEYNSKLERGGVRYLRYNYNDAEWAEYVASQPNGILTY